MNSINFPKLSEYDPPTSQEGAIDPLGLYSIADNLALRLIPGIRERMKHPRFLTAMAVGNVFTRKYDEDIIAAYGQTEPYLVYEWHMVEAMVRTRGDDEALSGFPGKRKAKDCIKDGLHLSAARYLKTATVFGFHGVYRLLADNLNIIRNSHLGENGYQLLATWEKEQSLSGFFNGNAGPGADCRQQLQSAIQDALNKGAVDRSVSWSGWQFFGQHLFPNEIPPMEKETLIGTILGEAQSSRAQVVRFLVSPEGQAVLEKTESEREFHLALLPHVDPDTRDLVETIVAYESFARSLQDAFDDCLALMTAKHNRTSPAELSGTPGCQRAHLGIPKAFYKVAGLLERYGQTQRFHESFKNLTETTTAEHWATLLLEHHVRVQERKPPQGKNPWFERFDDGAAVIRPAYRRYEGGKHDGSYVQAYRTFSLKSFASDLGML
jgi:hypothetical protein